LGVAGQKHLLAGLFLQHPADGGVADDAAGEHQGRPQAHGADHRHHPPDQGAMEPAQDRPDSHPVSDERHHLRFGEDGTGAGDGDLSRRGQRDLPHLLQRDAQAAGRVLQEPARSGGALIVHHEVHHLPSGADGDDFAILPADIHQRAAVAQFPENPAGVAGDFGDAAGGLPHQPAAVAGGDQRDAVQRAQRLPGLRQHARCLLLHLHLRWFQMVPDDVARRVHSDQFRRRRTDIYPQSANLSHTTLQSE
jgi:hypothetical protein